MNDTDEDTTLGDTPRDNSIMMDSSYDEEKISLARPE